MVNSVKDCRLNLRLDESTYSALKRKAEERKSPMNTMARMIIQEYCSENSQNKESTDRYIINLLTTACGTLTEEKADDRALRNIREAIDILKNVR